MDEARLEPNRLSSPSGPELRPTGEKILRTAIKLFSHRGFRQVSIRELTREVGIKESSLYNHFHSKNELLDVIFDTFLRAYQTLELTDEQIDEKIAAVSVDEFLRRSFMLFKGQMETARFERIYRILITEQFSNQRARRIVVDRLIRGPLLTWERVFARMAETGRISELDPRVLAAEFHYPMFALVYEYSIAKYDGEDTAPIERRISEHVNFFARTIATPGG
ncbi:MAG: TetR/AcrR family transcriptional regulator [bacterium]|nr:TetR/AcrR family transcriptional regulator [bacterium]